MRTQKLRPLGKHKAGTNPIAQRLVRSAQQTVTPPVQAASPQPQVPPAPPPPASPYNPNFTIRQSHFFPDITWNHEYLFHAFNNFDQFYNRYKDFGSFINNNIVKLGPEFYPHHIAKPIAALIEVKEPAAYSLKRRFSEIFDKINIFNSFSARRYFINNQEKIQKLVDDVNDTVMRYKIDQLSPEAQRRFGIQTSQSTEQPQAEQTSQNQQTVTPPQPAQQAQTPQTPAPVQQQQRPQPAQPQVANNTSQPPSMVFNKFMMRKNSQYKNMLQMNFRKMHSTADLPKVSADTGFRPEYFLLRKV